MNKEEAQKVINDAMVKGDRDVLRLACISEYKLENFPMTLDELASSENWFYRTLAAIQGYKLDVLINDKNCNVREAVANHGYKLDVLINDPDPYVRAAVAKQGYKLDVLINDPEEDVRAEVAAQGYGLDVLINDVPIVKFEAINKLIDIANS